MLTPKTHRNFETIHQMIDENDFNLLKKEAKEIVAKLQDINTYPINEAIIQTKKYLDDILPNFFEVFLNMTNYASSISIKDATIKWEYNSFNLPILEKIEQDIFYRSLLYYNHRLRNGEEMDFCFDELIETFWLKNNYINLLIYDFAYDNGYNKSLVFKTFNHLYLTDLITYFQFLDVCGDFKSYLENVFAIIRPMWHLSSIYEELNNVFINPSIYENEWKTYLKDKKQYLIDYLKQYKSKWKIQDLK